MRPIRLTLDGFLSYRDPETIDFTSFDVACITGENGAGKSSILDGMTFALFGKARVNSGDALINIAREDATVSFEFLLSEVHYRVIRKIYKNYRASESYLHYFDPSTDQFVTLSEATKSQTDAEIQKRLNMDHETFTTASFFLQGKADSFAKSTPADRKKILGKILHLEAWDQYYESAKERKKEAKGEGKVLESEVSFLGSEIKKEAEILKRNEENDQKLKYLSREIDQVSTNLGNVVQLIRNLVSLREEVKKKQESILKFKDQERNKRTQIDEKTKQRDAAKLLLDRADEILSAQKEFEKTNFFLNDQANLKLRIEGLEAQINEVEKLIITKEEQLSKKISQLRSQESKVLEDDLELEKLREKLAQLTRSTAEGEKIKNKIEELNGRKRYFDAFITTYTTYLTSNSALENMLTARKIEINELKTIETSSANAHTAIAKLELELTGAENKLVDLQSKQKEYISLKNNLSELENQIQRAEEDLSQVKDRANHLSEQHSPNCPTCEKALTEFEKTELLSKLNEETTTLRKRIDSISEDQHTLKLEQNQLLAHRSGVDPFGTEILSIERNLTALRTKIETQQETAAAWTTEKMDRLAELSDPTADLRRLESEVHDQMDVLQAQFKFFLPKSTWIDPATASKSVASEGNELNASIREFQGELQKLETIPVAIGETKTRIQTIEQTGAEWNKNGKNELLQAEDDLNHRTLVSIEIARIDELKAQIQATGYDPQKITLARSFIDQNAEQIEHDLSELKAAPGIVSDRNADILRLEEELGGLRSDVATLDEEIAEKQYAMGDEQGLISQRDLQETKLIDLESIRKELTIELGQAKQQLAGIAEYKIKLAEKQDLLDHVQKELINLEILEKAFGKNGVPALLIEQAKPEIEVEANRILSKLTDGFSVRFQTQKEYKNQKREDAQETLEIEISDGSGSRDYDTYSGGETFRVNFALRLALSKMLAHRADAKLETLVIDEGFGSQDEDGKQKLVEAIKAIQPEFKMILVITHMEELKEKFDRRIEVRKVGRSSHVSVS